VEDESSTSETRRTNVLHAGSLDVKVGDDGRLIVSDVRGVGGAASLHLRDRGRRLDQDHGRMSLIHEGGCCPLFFQQECSGRENSGTSSVGLFLHGFSSDYHGLEFVLELSGLDSSPGVIFGSHRCNIGEVHSLGREGGRQAYLGFRGSGSEEKNQWL
jgi:hypothetical protein